MVTRRALLTTGAASIVIVGSSLYGRSITRVPQTATLPWAQAGTGFQDARLNALSYAILAPNPHNRQPWLVELVGDDAFDLYCQLDRRLPDTDPFDRQITIGLGCFIELFEMAAHEAGFDVSVELFPEGESFPRLDSRKIAHINMSPSSVDHGNPLFSNALERRSTKTPYDLNKSVDGTTLDQLMTYVVPDIALNGSVEMEHVSSLRELTWQAFLVEYRTPNTRRESIDLMRFGPDEIDANPDGIEMEGPALEVMADLGLLTPETLDDPDSIAFSTGEQQFDGIINSAMGHVWLVSEGNTRHDQIVSGRNWMRVNLAAQKLGLAIHPLSQILQEYSEMTSLYEQFHNFVKVKLPQRVQMLGRIGYAKFPKPTPRWPLESRIV